MVESITNKEIENIEFEEPMDVISIGSYFLLYLLLVVTYYLTVFDM